MTRPDVDKSAREEVNPPPPPNNTEKTELQREPCPQCGRLFKLERLDKHIVACERAHRKRNAARRPRDAVARRGGRDAAAAVEARGAEGRREGGARAAAAVAAGSRRELRAAVKAGAKQSGPAEEAEICLEALPDDRVECPHCSRKFAPGPAERHIAACKDIRNKPTTLQRGTGTAAGAPSPRRPPARPPSTPGRMPSTPTGAASPAPRSANRRASVGASSPGPARRASTRARCRLRVSVPPAAAPGDGARRVAEPGAPTAHERRRRAGRASRRRAAPLQSPAARRPARLRRGAPSCRSALRRRRVCVQSRAPPRARRRRPPGARRRRRPHAITPPRPLAATDPSAADGAEARPRRPSFFKPAVRPPPPVAPPAGELRRRRRRRGRPKSRSRTTPRALRARGRSTGRASPPPRRTRTRWSEAALRVPRSAAPPRRRRAAARPPITPAAARRRPRAAADAAVGQWEEHQVSRFKGGSGSRLCRGATRRCCGACGTCGDHFVCGVLVRIRRWITRLRSHDMGTKYGRQDRRRRLHSRVEVIPRGRPCPFVRLSHGGSWCSRPAGIRS